MIDAKLLATALSVMMAMEDGMSAETGLSIREWQKLAEGKNVFEFPRPFIVCPKCGNKRCPHATDRALECTDSNDPGQKGSYYE